MVIDHITSPSALILPVEDIVRHCHDRGIPVLIDGAHAPGMIDLDVDRIGADYYVGNCHKWLCAPKGSAFLAIGRNAPGVIHPNVISHAFGQGFTAEFDKVGSRDPSAWLSVPAAIAFHTRLGGPSLRERNRALAIAEGNRLAAALGEPLSGPETMLGSMACVRLPDTVPAERENAAFLHDHIWQHRRAEVLVVVLHGALWMRISAHAYNEAADYDGLAEAVISGLAAAGTTGARSEAV